MIIHGLNQTTDVGEYRNTLAAVFSGQINIAIERSSAAERVANLDAPEQGRDNTHDLTM